MLTDKGTFWGQKYPVNHNNLKNEKHHFKYNLIKIGLRKF